MPNWIDDAVPLPHPPAPRGWQAFGWAGYLLSAPNDYRPLRTEGDGRKGLMVIGDRESPRLELRWATQLRRFFDAERYLTKRLIRESGRGVDVEHIDRRISRGFDPMIRLIDASPNVDRYGAYCPATHRLLSLAHYVEDGARGSLLRKSIWDTLVDQPQEKPQRWAFFDNTLLSPPGFRYDRSQLFLGDMSVTFTRSERTFFGPLVTIRQIYPGDLALKRQPLDLWTTQQLKELRKQYVPILTRAQQKSMEYDRVDTPIGEAIEVTLRLRRGLRPFLWSAPRRMKLQVIHYEAANRLLVLVVATPTEEIDDLVPQLQQAVQWGKRDP